ncbi:hypothetical protein BGX27_005035 [Mortierella sp. AM989]|nr:hypothetical protein BGX27_005035 [Mortierella sp. AM989]
MVINPDSRKSLAAAHRQLVRIAGLGDVDVPVLKSYIEVIINSAYQEHVESRAQYKSSLRTGGFMLKIIDPEVRCIQQDIPIHYCVDPQVVISALTRSPSATFCSKILGT